MTRAEIVSKYGEERYMQYLSNRKAKKDKIKQYVNTYNLTPSGRARYLFYNYRKLDRNKGWECTLTPDWIKNNVFGSKCVYCGEGDWKKLGVDRIENSKPHTKENSVCCCMDCNRKRGTKTMEEFQGIVTFEN